MKVVLTIAGSDSSGGAGIQADLKTFEAFGLFGASAITVLTAQNTTGVSEIVPMTPEFVKQQIQMVLDDFDVAAIKIGMLYSKEIIHAVHEMIQDLSIPIVLDPVAISKAGSELIDIEAIDAMHLLFEDVTLITPNHYEAYTFFGYTHNDPESRKQIEALNTPILVKHLAVEHHDTIYSVDQLFFQEKQKTYRTPMVHTSNLHGTGCSYASAIAANLALGHPLDEAIKISKAYIVQALRSAPNIGHGPGPICHKRGVDHAQHCA